MQSILHSGEATRVSRIVVIQQDEKCPINRPGECPPQGRVMPRSTATWVGSVVDDGRSTIGATAVVAGALVVVAESLALPSWVRWSDKLPKHIGVNVDGLVIDGVKGVTKFHRSQNGGFGSIFMQQAQIGRLEWAIRDDCHCLVPQSPTRKAERTTLPNSDPLNCLRCAPRNRPP